AGHPRKNTRAGPIEMAMSGHFANPREWQIWRMSPLRSFAFLSLAACSGGAASAPPVAAASSSSPTTAAGANAAGEYAFTRSRTGDVHDFDFLAGAWTLQNRRLKRRLVGSSDWEEFPAVDCAVLYLSGVVNVDELHFQTKGWSGVTF